MVTHTQRFLIEESFIPPSFSVFLMHSQGSYLQRMQMANEGLANAKAIRMDLSPGHTQQYSNPDSMSYAIQFLGSLELTFFPDMRQGGQKGASVKQ